MAHALVRAGKLSANQWAQALGAALKEAETEGRPDTEDNYYLAALAALEHVAPIEMTDLEARKTDWENAYRRTPHGQPVTL